MAYEKKPGDLAVFKNTKKEKDTHPDYTITGLTLDGQPMKGALWLKEDRNGNKFMAGKIEVDTYQQERSGGTRSVESPREDRRNYDLNDDIPF